MRINILIKNGHVIDPANKVDEIKNVVISNGFIVEENSIQPDIILDAKGKYIFPGLIDYHAHIAVKSTELGIDADTSMLNQGVVSAVDAGSCGISSFEDFVENIVNRSKMNIQAFINLCPAGLATMKYHEDYNPKYWDEKQLRYFFTKYSDLLLGVKIRISKPILGDYGFRIFEKAVEFASKLNTRLCVHTTDPVGGMAKVAKLLRKGDILAHCFHGTGSSIIGENGKVLPEIIEAQKRGVIMDAANGSNHWSFITTDAAIKSGFYPDVISTDLSCKTLYKDPVFSLPYIMSKYLMLGMPLTKIIKAVTITPASLMNSNNGLGTLSVGAEGNVSVFALENKDIVFSDTQKRTRMGHQVLVPQLTVCQGKIVYRNITFQ